MVLTGAFRDDLYYRLNVFPVKVPPLRERKEDIPWLVTHFVQKFSKRLGKQIDTIPEHVQVALREYHWPGNIRELENVIERAVILANDATLRVDDSLGNRPAAPRTAVEPAVDQRSLEQVERAHILGVLEQTRWRIGGDDGAAVILNLHPNTLRSRMKKLGIAKRVDN